MRQKLVVGNWKMHGTLDMLRGFVVSLKPMLAPLNIESGVCVPFPYLSALSDQLAREAIADKLAVGAQNLSEHAAGAYTGEVSAAMLADLACRYVIVGHSERRALYGESSEQVGRKVEAALHAGLTPILCVGETLVEREAGAVATVLHAQLDAVKTVIGAEQFARLVVAYEPVWAIGTGVSATPEQVRDTLALVRAWLQAAGAEAQKIKILYGGSVKPETAEDLFALADCDGGLIGGASLVATDFAEICQAAQRASINMKQASEASK